MKISCLSHFKRYQPEISQMIFFTPQHISRKKLKFNRVKNKSYARRTPCCTFFEGAIFKKKIIIITKGDNKNKCRLYHFHVLLQLFGKNKKSEHH